MKFNKVKRNPSRGIYDVNWINDILSESPFINVGIAVEGKSIILPMAFGREGEKIFLHGASANFLLKNAKDEINVCLSSTFYDGLVLAKSVFHHSMNYRSVVLYGKAKAIEEENLKLEALRVITDHICPGRWREARRPNQKELRSTLVLEVKIESGSGKERKGPPIDDPEDENLPFWSGLIPWKGGYEFPKYASNQAEPDSVKGLLKI